MESKRPLILLTNDDGIDSPGLRAAAEAIGDLGDLLIVAPMTQQTSTGRSFIRLSDGRLERREVLTSRGPLPAFALDASPAPVVRWGILVLAPRRPDLVVAGINYGENIGTGVTVSGTIGACIEAAAAGVPALAMSLQTSVSDHLRYNEALDLSAAAHFTRLFTQRLLEHNLPRGVDILKVDVPTGATPETPCKLTRVSRQPYFVSIIRDDGHGGRRLAGYEIRVDPDMAEPDSDVYALAISRVVAVAPLSIDLTAEGHWEELSRMLGASQSR